tara:strand:- start:298 stop:1266 length:969 start_codon:yes stop_codon:yes gene_type:complete
MKFIKILLLFLVLSSCIKQEKVEMQIPIYRFDKELFSIDSNNYEDKVNDWDAILPEFYDYFLRHHIYMKYSSDSARKSNVLMFASHPDVISFQKSIEEKFKNVKYIEEKFNRAFSSYSEFFPDSTIPKKIIFSNSFNSYAVDVFNENLLIGLDFYLGESHPAANIWDYLKVRYDEKFLMADAMEYWITSMFINKNNTSNFQENLIFKGKIMYLIKMILKEQDNIVFRFSEENINWCEMNESNIWNEIISLDIMYNKDYNAYSTFFSDSPFTKGMPKESPGRLGYWVGYKIIESYMNNNRVSLSDLMKNDNSQEILLQSKYKP